MKNNPRNKLLENLNRASCIFSELLEIFLSSPSALYKKRYEILNGPSDRIKKTRRIKNKAFISNISDKDKRRFYDIVYNLKKDNLINIEKRKGLKYLSITNLGKKILSKLKMSQKYRFNKYEKVEGKEYKIIIFDIPEKDKNKRYWLRKTLKYLGFSMLQKSAWIGKLNLDEQFLKDLKDLNLFQYIEIFSLNKEGVSKFLK